MNGQMFLFLEVLSKTLLQFTDVNKKLSEWYRLCLNLDPLSFPFFHLSVVIWYFWKLILVCGRGGMIIPPGVVAFGNVHGPVTVFPSRLRNSIHRGKGWKVKCQWTTKGRVNITKQWWTVHTHFSCKASLIGHLFPQTCQVPPSSHLLMGLNTCCGYRL